MTTLNAQDVTAIEAASIPCLPMSAQSAAFGDVVYVHQAVSVPVDERCHCLVFSHKLSIDTFFMHVHRLYETNTTGNSFLSVPQA